MTRDPDTGRLKQCVAGMVALEDRIEGLLDRLRAEVRGHPATAAAFERFHAVAKGQRDRLAAHLQELGGPTAQVEAHSSPPAAGGASGAGGAGVCTGTASQALRGAYLAFNEAAIGYGVLHETAHLFDSMRFSATLQLAERHLRSYAAAAQEINQLIADVVAWEMRQEGQFCACQCPACGLGICWCIAHTTDTINRAWRETAPVYPSGGLRVAPNGRGPADLDVQEGDLVIAVDGQRVATTSDVTRVVMSRAPGEPIKLGIERRSVGGLEIIVTRR